MWVDKNGSDVLGDGTFANPFLTIPRALLEAAAGIPSTTKRYVIHVGSGDFAENIELIPWVTILGVQQFNSRINGTVTLAINGSWTPNVDLRSTLSDLTFRSSVVIDFAAAGVLSSQGKVNIYASTFNTTPVFNGFNAINQIRIEDSFALAGVTVTGLNFTTIATAFVNGGTITVNNSVAQDNQPTIFAAVSGGADGPLTVTWTPNIHINTGITLILSGFEIQGAVILDGAQITTNTSTDVLPPNVTLLNGAPLPIYFAGAVGNLFMFGGNFAGGGVSPVFFGNALPTATPGNSTVALNYPISPDRLVQKLQVNVLTNTLDALATLDVLQNGAATGISVSIPASTPGVFSNTTNLNVFFEGDLLDVRLTSAAGVGSIELVGSVLIV